jgi:hypothetical protein
MVTTPGPVTAASYPALINLPTLTITSVGGIATPGTPGGLYATADVVLPAGTTNPVTISLTATNTPVGTTFSVRLLQQFANSVTVTSTASTGTFASSTATASMTLPVTQINVLQAWGALTLP